MILKRILVGILAFLAYVFSDEELNPKCTPRVKNASVVEGNFFFYVDSTREEPVFSRIIYLFKAFACEVPTNGNFTVLAMSGGHEEELSSDVNSSYQTPNLLRDFERDSSDGSSTECQRFDKTLKHIPATFLNVPNVQFMVPIFETDSNCSMLEVFQSKYGNDPRKGNFYFNGILVNTKLTATNKQSVRMIIPDIEDAIDLKKPSLGTSDNVSSIHGSNQLVESITSMFGDILAGNSEHDWEPIEPTTAEQTTSSVTVPTTTSEELTTTTSEEEDGDEFLAFDTEKRMIPKGDGDNTTELTSSTIPELGTTTFPDSSTEANETYIINAIHDPYKVRDEDRLEEELNPPDFANSDNDFFVVEPVTRKSYEADFILLVVCLIILIWVFAIFLCLVCIFYCSEDKREEMEDDLETQKKLEEEAPEEQKKPLLAAKTSSSENDSDEEEWRKIKPAPPVSLKSETESAYQAPKARYDAVQVSEREDGNTEREPEQRPRHGFMPGKNTAELQFE